MKTSPTFNAGCFVAPKNWRNQRGFPYQLPAGAAKSQEVHLGKEELQQCSHSGQSSWHCCAVAKSYSGCWRWFFPLAFSDVCLIYTKGSQQPGASRVNLSLTLFLLTGFKCSDLEGFSKPVLLCCCISAALC